MLLTMTILVDAVVLVRNESFLSSFLETLRKLPAERATKNTVNGRFYRAPTHFCVLFHEYFVRSFASNVSCTHLIALKA
jgi:hypothetical protein